MFYTTSLISPALENAPVDLDSQQVIVSPDGTYYVGLDGKDLQVARGSKVLGTMPRFSDHTLNNAAVTRTSDGILHILGTEVLISHDNSSRVHYLRFDPAQSRWLGDDLLMVRAKFTSTSTPKIACIGESVDAFWHRHRARCSSAWPMAESSNTSNLQSSTLNRLSAIFRNGRARA